MSTFDRRLANEVLRLDLRAELEATRGSETVAKGRVGRTLVKDGPLGVTLVSLSPGGHIATHRSSGPITIQPIAGVIALEAAGGTHEVAVGEMLALGANVDHAVSSPEGGAFLLTVALPGTAEPR